MLNSFAERITQAAMTAAARTALVSVAQGPIAQGPIAQGPIAQGPIAQGPASSQQATWGELNAEVDRWHERLRTFAGRPLGFALAAQPAAFAALGALDRLAADTYLLDSRISDAQLSSLAQQYQWAGWVAPDPECPSQLVVRDLSRPAADDAATADASTDTAPPAQQARLRILTSGTTGTPKVIEHTWSSLLRPARPSPAGPRGVWLLSYQPYLYAGLQILAQWLTDAAQLVASDPSASIEHWAKTMVERQVSHASGTPAFWRRLTTFVDPETLAAIPIQQITLGGEAVDQPLLDRLRAIFPQAAISHIYATTELGRCFSVRDARAGFPSAWLEQPPRHVQLKLVDDELHVRSPNCSAAAPDRTDRWIATGDLVRIEGDRCLFAGRLAEIINVGGNKVAPLKVESVIRSVPGVRDVRVYGVESSLTGQLVSCDVVLDQSADPQQTKSRVAQVCREQLARHEVPRIVHVVEAIRVSSGGKVLRREQG